MNVYFYCPDRHIIYGGDTAERTGVGGGITVRLRMAAALAELGHTVTVACNCSARHSYRGANYVPLDEVAAINTGVLIVHSTAGTGVSKLTAMPVKAWTRILLVDGIPQPPGSDRIEVDWVYPCSNFIARVIQRDWTLPGAPILVSHHGIIRRKAEFFDRFHSRDPYRLIYTSHPSKGLEAAVAVLRRLRRLDPRFSLHCHGGDRLWGGNAAFSYADEGVHDHGLTGQDELMRCYGRSMFAMNLQTREEPFGISLAEAMGAGCIVVASPVGAYPELVHDGRTGIMVAGNPSAEATLDEAAGRILEIVNDRAKRSQMSRNAAAAPLDWSTVAATWVQHWEWLAEGSPTPDATCTVCGGSALRLADGLHCIRGAHYER